MQTWLHPDCRA